MTEGPLSILSITPSTYTRYPRKRLVFITIKDNSQKTRWVQIGKINDWIRKYSTTYAIVRGTENGTHFHILAGLKDDKPMRFQKGIHFHVKYLTKKTGSFTRDDQQWALEGKDMADSIRAKNIIHTQYNLTDDQQMALQGICDEIRKINDRKVARASRVKSLTRKEKDIQDVIDYLHKNLNEPREGDTRVYHDYIVRD